MVFLSVRDLDVAYASGAHALRGVSIEVGAGERVGIVGANGAGKTTVARAVTGLSAVFRATVRQGRISVADRDTTRWPAWRVLGAGVVTIPEGRGVISNMTVEDNLRLVLAALPRSRRPAVTEAYEMYPVLGERRRSMAGLLSGGEQQMLAVARALLVRPRLIVADELSLGLAPRIVTEILDGLAARAANEGTAVLLIEQAVVMSLRFVERAYVLDQGTVVAQGTSDELRQAGDTTARYLGVADLSRSEELL
ncbi:ABC transporter ATP-binding protein [Acrocarpospora pleiomorpha]|uniref:ABC transporter ATP-binding protein n=1 Tax=Acrocarpospora pleiomorpha TaxID=90975 RepID=A0A5M3Y3Q7_9ACTN|nr:ABC transporter ATP-binding protein [Acrocarpospora pleiomorpha]